MFAAYIGSRATRRVGDGHYTEASEHSLHRRRQSRAERQNYHESREIWKDTGDTLMIGSTGKHPLFWETGNSHQLTGSTRE